MLMPASLIFCWKAWSTAWGTISVTRPMRYSPSAPSITSVYWPTWSENSAAWKAGSRNVSSAEIQPISPPLLE